MFRAGVPVENLGMRHFRESIERVESKQDEPMSDVADTLG